VWPSMAQQTKLFSTHELEMKNHLINVLFIYILQNMWPALTIGTSLCNNSYDLRIK